MKLRTKIAGGLLATAALVGVANVAYAGAFDERFDVVAPIWQNAVLTDSQEKVFSNMDGHVNVDTVGASYAADAQECHLLDCGQKVFGLVGGSGAALLNTIAAGDLARASFQISSFNVVSVEITGTWRSE